MIIVAGNQYRSAGVPLIIEGLTEMDEICPGQYLFCEMVQGRNAEGAFVYGTQ